MTTMKTHVIIIANSDNPDRNTPADIAEAVKHCVGCQDVEVATNGVIEATVRSVDLADIHKMEGVAYIRNEMTYAASD